MKLFNIKSVQRFISIIQQQGEQQAVSCDMINVSFVTCRHAVCIAAKENSSEKVQLMQFSMFNVWYISWCFKVLLPITLTLLKSTLLQSLVTSGLRSCALVWVWGRIIWPVHTIITQNTCHTDRPCFAHANYQHLQLKQSISTLPVLISQSREPPSLSALQWRNIVMNRYASVQITAQRKRETENRYVIYWCSAKVY